MSNKKSNINVKKSSKKRIIMPIIIILIIIVCVIIVATYLFLNNKNINQTKIRKYHWKY